MKDHTDIIVLSFAILFLLPLFVIEYTNFKRMERRIQQRREKKNMRKHTAYKYELEVDDGICFINVINDKGEVLTYYDPTNESSMQEAVDDLNSMSTAINDMQSQQS